MLRKSFLCRLVRPATLFWTGAVAEAAEKPASRRRGDTGANAAEEMSGPADEVPRPFATASGCSSFADLSPPGPSNDAGFEKIFGRPVLGCVITDLCK